MNERDDKFSAALLKVAPLKHRQSIYKWRVRGELPLWIQIALDNPQVAYLILAFAIRYAKDDPA